MKVLFFTENTHCGGLDTFIASLANRWPHPEDELALVCNEDHPGLKVIRKRLTRRCKIEGHRIPIYAQSVLRLQKYPLLHAMRKCFGPVLKYLFFFYNVVALRPLLLKNRPDRLFVINGGYPAGDSCRAAIVSWKLFSRKRAAVLNIHNLASSPRWFEKIQEGLLDFWISRSSSQIVCVSRTCSDSFSSRKILQRFNAPTYIYNGIAPAHHGHPAKEHARKSLGVPSHVLLCSVLATYEPRKGHDFLLKAFQQIAVKVPHACLLLCGYGKPHEVSQVKELVASSRVAERVRMYGFLDNGAVMAATDLILIPSQAYESFGLVAVEAFAAKVPVVATNVGGLVETVADGEGGYLVDREDIETFAQRAVMLLKDPALRKEQGEKGYRRYQKMFTADRMAREYAALVRN